MPRRKNPDERLVHVTNEAEINQKLRRLARKYFHTDNVDEAFRRIAKGELRNTVVADEMIMLREFRDAK